MSIPLQTWWTVIVSDPESPELGAIPMGRTKHEELALDWIAHLRRQRPDLDYMVREIGRPTWETLWAFFGKTPAKPAHNDPIPIPILETVE